MKAKTINAVITKKINDWLSSIDDPVLVKKIKNNIIVTGGCITSMLLNEEVNDFDVYIKTKESLKLLSEHYTRKFNSNNAGNKNKMGKELKAWVLDGLDVELWMQNKKRLSEFAFDYPDFEYSNVVNWAYDETDPNCKAHLQVSGMILNTPSDRIKIMINSDGIAEDSDSIADNAEYDINKYLDAIGDGDTIPDTVIETGEVKTENKYRPIFLSTNAITLSNKIQVVVRFYGEPKEIHENYDFIHATNYWTYSEGVVLNQRALESILNKELFYVGSKYPICSLVRTRKFIKRGWQINAGQYVKMAFQISQLDLTNIYVLEDQLIGVDSVYFLAFIENLKKKQITDEKFVLENDYLTTVIDKIFG